MTPADERAAVVRPTCETCAPAIPWTPAPDVPGAYRVGHSLNSHPADGMTATVCIGDGAFMTIINPQSFKYGGVEWGLRFGDPDAVRYTAASAISSYDYLLSDESSMKEATRRLRVLRNARRALSRSQADAD